MSEIQIRFLDAIEITALHKTFLEAFSDYVTAMNPTEEQFREFFDRRGIDLNLSVGAFADGELMAFNLNAFGDFAGALTVYDVATGVVPAYRRKGIARALFEFSLPRLLETKASRYLLEVISTNHAAVAAYDAIGFRKIRTLQAYRKTAVSPPLKQLPNGLRFEEINLDWDLVQAFWSWEPSWQNSIASVKRSRAMKHVLGGLLNDQLVAYGIVYPVSGDIPQFAVHPSYRRLGIGSHLIHVLQQKILSGAGRIINIDTSDSATSAFLDGIGWERLLNQHEMELKFKNK